ncbi:MAG: hypothetical protein NE328_03215 [Lentisphaeraceae bacterium]|nr:hypothetical protein [Lentisphaeraceae bacterium]
MILIPAGMAKTATDPLSSMPLAKMFWSLYQERNVIGQNDCSNKCGRYVRALIAEGYKAEIVVIRPHTSRYLHAIVKLQDGDKVTYLDPTKGIISKDLKVLGSFEKLIAHNQLDGLGAQYR